MRAKSHDQRKGQWLINKIRFENTKYPNMTKEESDKLMEKLGFDGYFNVIQARIERILFNIENDEFDGYMEDYNK